MAEAPTCAVCFESLWEPNAGCPAPEGHLQPYTPPAPHPKTITWVTYHGRNIHLTCIPEGADNMDPYLTTQRAVDADGLCDICGTPLDVLP